MPQMLCAIYLILEMCLQTLKKLLKKDGIFVFEDPYLGDGLKNSYDQIYDEHVFLFLFILSNT